jgi:tRNA/tmRNA/rRNA uracil-C5-methylase (TrmA/RlmC/RlmD family)
MSKPPKNFKPEPFLYHQEIELTIDTLTNLGDGLGRIDGWVVMVPFTLPGERIRARVYRNHKNYSQADLVEILEASMERKKPDCPLFGECGGCQYQHLTYEGQLKWKRQQVVELFQKGIGDGIEVNETHPSPKKLNYRSKITPHHQRPIDGKLRAIGFLHHSRRNYIIDVPQCPIATEWINTKLKHVRKEAQEKAKENHKKGATLLLRDTGDAVVTDPKELVFTKVGSLQFQFKAGDFFQNNPFILEAFTNYAVRQAAADPEVEYLVDAYCGGGLFTLFASQHFKECAGVEINAYAVMLAKTNASANNITNCSFLQSPAEAIFKGIPYPADKTAILMDPPRKGCDREFIDQLIAYSPKRIVYVSCDPATQVRDLKPVEEAGYQISAAQPFDLFPQTRHIENVVTLVKN